MSESTDIAIIGAGVIGCAVAYYLSRECDATIGVYDTHAPGTQASSRAAGLMGQARGSHTLCSMVGETYQTLAALQDELGRPLGVTTSGSLSVADSPGARASLHHLCETVVKHDVACRHIDAATATAMVPWLRRGETSMCLHLPTDACADAYQVTAGYAEAARGRGVRFRKECHVLDILTSGRRVEGVVTEKGIAHCGVVIVAAGVWSGLLLRPLGVNLPMAPVRSHYWITAPEPCYHATRPFVLLPDARAYARTEVGGLLFGVREKESYVQDARLLPHDLNGYAVGDDRDGIESLAEGIEAVTTYLPGLDEKPLAHYIAGFSAYTPDSRYILGGIDRYEGLYCAAGCCGAGLAASGGVGKLVMESVLCKQPTWDAGQFRWDRFDNVDAAEPVFQQRCATARSRKVSG